MDSQPDRHEMLRGILFIVLSSTVFGCVDGFSKLLTETQPFTQIVWARYALSFPVVLAATPPARWGSLFRTGHLRLQILRALTPLVVSAGMVLGVNYLPLADATVILFAGPFVVVALSAPLLGERVRLASWIGVTAGFLAILLVARPGVSALSVYTLYPLAAAVFFAFQQLITRRLGALGEKPTTTLAWTLLVGSIVVTPIAVATWAPLSGRAWFYMIGLGTVFGAAQLLLARAFSHAPAAVLAPFSYIQIISAVVFGILVFGNVPDLWTLLGIVIIISAGVYVIRSRR